ncbi:MAG: TIGR04255 family protein [Thermoleophilia bacterium]|nr:TIGR04255 family protein [Thermoleophilia bacterium]
MPNKASPSPVYPNSPLVEVACEIRFPGEMSVECKRDIFFSAIRQKYPKIYVPKSSEGKPMSLEPYRFQNEEDTAGVGLAINSFSYYEKQYQGHEKFIKEFMRLAKILEKIVPLNKLNRVGWRYINIIPFVRQDQEIPLDSFFSISVEVPKGNKSKFENISLVLATRNTSDTIVTRLQTVQNTEDDREAFLLDFDYSIQQNLVFSKLRSNLKTAHQETSGLFENLITEEYREYLRGEQQ